MQELTESELFAIVKGILDEPAAMHSDETGELLQRGLGWHDRIPHLEQRMYQETDGNPLFVLETLRALQDEGMLLQDEAGRWSMPWGESASDGAELPLPVRIFQVISRRLARLAAGERTVLDVAAVLGSDSDFALLARAGGLSGRR